MPAPSNLDSVAATFPQSRINEVLAVIHRRGHGHHARLIRCDSGDIAAQLERAGVPQTVQLAISENPDSCVLVIESPRQTASVAGLLLGLGALHVERYTGTRPVSTLLSFDVSVLESHSRRGSARTP